MSKLPLSEYAKVCAFVYFSDELENKLNIRIELIMGLIHIYNNFRKLISMRQTVYNGINLIQLVNFMNTWKLNETLENFKKTVKK